MRPLYSPSPSPCVNQAPRNRAIMPAMPKPATSRGQSSATPIQPRNLSGTPSILAATAACAPSDATRSVIIDGLAVSCATGAKVPPSAHNSPRLAEERHLPFSKTHLKLEKATPGGIRLRKTQAEGDPPRFNPWPTMNSSGTVECNPVKYARPLPDQDPRTAV